MVPAGTDIAEFLVPAGTDLAVKLLSHDHVLHLSQRWGMSPHDYKGLLVAQSFHLGPDSEMFGTMRLALIVIIV